MIKTSFGVGCCNCKHLPKQGSDLFAYPQLMNPWAALPFVFRRTLDKAEDHFSLLAPPSWFSLSKQKPPSLKKNSLSRFTGADHSDQDKIMAASLCLEEGKKVHGYLLCCTQERQLKYGPLIEVALILAQT